MSTLTAGIFAKTFPGTSPWPVFEAVKDAGFTTVQYNMACSGLASMPDELPDAIALDVSAAAAAYGIQIAALSATYNMIHPDRAERERGHQRLRILAKAARLMGTDLLTLCTGTRDPEDQWREHPDNNTPAAWDDLVESMRTAVSIAEEFDVYLGVEPELANVINSADKARALIDTVASKRIKIVLDPANLFEVEPLGVQRAIVAHGIQLLAQEIVLTHAKDRAPNGSFQPAGSGVLDYDHYISCLRNIGYVGPLITHGLEQQDAPAVARFLSQKLRESERV